MNVLSRRNFVKGIGLAAAIPLLPQVLYADNGESKRSAAAVHKVLCCNIRVALPEDDEAGVGWNDRRKACVEVMRARKPDIICMQEVLRVQNEDLKNAFPNFFSYGFEGPEMDAHKEGYHGIAKNPIFFSKDRYELLSAGGFWLSETPLIGGSMSWGTARARHANWVRLKDKRSGQDFRVINLHLDHKSQEAREQQTKLVLEESKQYAPDYLQILAGDFNARASNPVYKQIRSEGWTDSYTSIHGEAEPGFTVHSFEGENHPKKAERGKIDFIFTRGNSRSVAAKIIKDQVNGRYPSDHYFVSADLVFEEAKQKATIN